MVFVKATTDYSTFKGASLLVGKIKEYWARRGLFPIVFIERSHMTAAELAKFDALFTVRSDMLYGRPVRVSVKRD